MDKDGLDIATKSTKRHEKWRSMAVETVIGCAIEVYRELVPGLLESTYEQCLAYELKLNRVAFRLSNAKLSV